MVAEDFRACDRVCFYNWFDALIFGFLSSDFVQHRPRKKKKKERDKEGSHHKKKSHKHKKKDRSKSPVGSSSVHEHKIESIKKNSPEESQYHKQCTYDSSNDFLIAKDTNEEAFANKVENAERKRKNSEEYDQQKRLKLSDDDLLEKDCENGVADGRNVPPVKYISDLNDDKSSMKEGLSSNPTVMKEDDNDPQRKDCVRCGILSSEDAKGETNSNTDEGSGESLSSTYKDESIQTGSTNNSIIIHSNSCDSGGDKLSHRVSNTNLAPSENQQVSSCSVNCDKSSEATPESSIKPDLHTKEKLLVEKFKRTLDVEKVKQKLSGNKSDNASEVIAKTKSPNANDAESILRQRHNSKPSAEHIHKQSSPTAACHQNQKSISTHCPKKSSHSRSDRGLCHKCLQRRKVKRMDVAVQCRIEKKLHLLSNVPFKVPRLPSGSPFKNMRFGKFIHLEKDANGGASVLRMYHKEIAGLSEKEKREVAKEFLKVISIKLFNLAAIYARLEKTSFGGLQFCYHGPYLRSNSEKIICSFNTRGSM